MRHETGKTAISTIIARFGCALSVPLLGLCILFALAGGWALIPVFVAAYAGTCVVGVFLQWLGCRVVTDWLWGNDPDWRRWRQGGGDPYFDALGLVNTDSGATRAAAPPVHDDMPPQSFCPRCGGALTLWEGRQCGTCYSYWNPHEQQWYFWEPDPRTHQGPGP